MAALKPACTDEDGGESETEAHMLDAWEWMRAIIFLQENIVLYCIYLCLKSLDVPRVIKKSALSCRQ